MSDWKAQLVTSTLAARANGTEVAEAVANPVLTSLIDWWQLDGAQRPPEDFLVEPLLPRGRLVSIYSKPKVGKSLLALEVAAAVATGRAVLDSPASDPRPVLYVDAEMSLGDVRERLEDLAYTPTAEHLVGRLHYASTPATGPLDQPVGGAWVAEAAAELGAALVVVDTLRSTVAGAENDSDTIAAFKRSTVVPLLNLDLTVLVLDHSGHGDASHARGSSAKAADADVSWQLTMRDGNRLELDHHGSSRLAWVPRRVVLERCDDQRGLRHAVVADTLPDGTEAMVVQLDAIGVPIDATRRSAAHLLREAGGVGRNDVILAAQRLRRRRPAKGLPWPR